MNTATLPSRRAWNETVLLPRPLAVIPCSCSRRRMSATGNRRSRFQSNRVPGQVQVRVEDEHVGPPTRVERFLSLYTDD